MGKACGVCKICVFMRLCVYFTQEYVNVWADAAEVTGDGGSPEVLQLIGRLLCSVLAHTGVTNPTLSTTVVENDIMDPHSSLSVREPPLLRAQCSVTNSGDACVLSVRQMVQSLYKVCMIGYALVVVMCHLFNMPSIHTVPAQLFSGYISSETASTTTADPCLVALLRLMRILVRLQLIPSQIIFAESSKSSGLSESISNSNSGFVLDPSYVILCKPIMPMKFSLNDVDDGYDEDIFSCGSMLELVYRRHLFRLPTPTRGITGAQAHSKESRTEAFALLYDLAQSDNSLRSRLQQLLLHEPAWRMSD